MANSNGIIYIDTQSTPNKGIEIADLQEVLGASDNDLKSLYNSHTVKMFSRYKPVPWNRALNPQETHPDDWQKGKDGDYGIKSTTLRPNEASQIASVVDGGLNGWSYERDTMARMLDFNGYNHGVQSAFGTLHSENIYNPNNFAPNEDVKIRIDGDVVSSGQYQLSVYGDIEILGYYGGSERTQLLEVDELYIGFIVFYRYNNQWVFQKCIILSDTIGQLNPPHLYNLGPFTKPGPIANWPVDFRVYPALFDTDEIDSESGLPRNGYNIVPVPGWSYNDLRVTETVAPGYVYGTMVANVDYDPTTGTYNNIGNFECYLKGNDHYQTTLYVTVHLKTTGGTLVKTLYSNVSFVINPGDTVRIGRADDNLTFNQSGTDSPPYFYVPGITAQNFYQSDGYVEVYINESGQSARLVASQRFYQSQH